MGSIAIDGGPLDAEGKRPNEKVSVADVDSMNRFETWVVRCARGREVIGVHGAAAQLTATGNTAGRVIR